MSGSTQGSSALKRKREGSDSKSDSLPELERKIYDAIRSKTNMGMSKPEMKKLTNLTDMKLITKTLKALLEDKRMIKEVKGIQSKGRGGFYMAVEFEPSAELTGGAWYTDGNLDMQVVGYVKKACLRIIKEHEVVTLKEVLAEVERSKILTIKVSLNDMKEILEGLVLDNEVIKVGEDNYKCCSRCNRGEPALGSMASIPCGVCPRINQCTPDGLISPSTCEYFNKWMEF